MSKLKKLRTLLPAVGMVIMATGLARAQELLTNGDLEASATIPGWTLEETITGMPGVPINSAQQQGFANEPEAIDGEFGLWLRAFEGNIGEFDGQNLMTNAFLSQTVPGVAGETYTFTGHSLFEPNYSGGVEFLDPVSPSGFVESPTESIWELAFLNSNDEVIGTPVTLDLRTEQFGDDMWREHTLMGTAPAGTANVRVTAAAEDMVFNINPMQSAFYDNFSLTTESQPATELLTNADFNEPPPELPGWTLTELPEGTDTGETASFANDPATGGQVGFWLRAFAGGDAILSQTVEGVPGGNYTFSASSLFEIGYSGGLPDTTTETFMELAFLDSNEEVIGDPLVLDLLEEGQMSDDMWRRFSLEGIAPPETASVRVSAGATGMFDTDNNPQSAFFDDLSLVLETAGVPGDYNENGIVDAADYTVWRDNLGANVTLPNEAEGVTPGMVTQEDFDFWKTNFGNSGSGSGSLLGTAAVPETASCVLAMVAMVGAGVFCRRRAA